MRIQNKIEIINQTQQIKTVKSKKNEDIIDLKPNAIDEDVADYVEEDSEQFKTLNNLKTVEKGWMVSHFVSGAKLAYEEILMAFETGDLEKNKKNDF